MNIIRIYDISKDDDIQILVDKLKAEGADIEKYNIVLEQDKLEESAKIKRLYSVYGYDIFPVTVINGEIVKVESHLEPNEIIAQSGLLMKKNARADGCGECSRCGCSKSNCGTCGSKNQ